MKHLILVAILAGILAGIATCDHERLTASDLELIDQLNANLRDGRAASNSNDDYDDNNQQPTSVSVPPREPGAGLLLVILREFFADIDWHAIAVARDQVEKFIHKVDRLLRSFRRTKPAESKADTSNSGGGSGSGSGDEEASKHRISRIFGGRWWSPAPAASKVDGSAADPTNLKEMLERVACFVGYIRLMNYSNEALAELQASKAISSLFGSGGVGGGGGGGKTNSTGGYFGTWFG